MSLFRIKHKLSFTLIRLNHVSERTADVNPVSIYESAKGNKNLQLRSKGDKVKKWWPSQGFFFFFFTDLGFFF